MTKVCVVWPTRYGALREVAYNVYSDEMDGELKKILQTLATSLQRIADRDVAIQPKESGDGELRLLAERLDWHKRIGWGAIGLFLAVMTGFLTWYLPKELSAQSSSLSKDFTIELGKQLSPMIAQLADLNARVTTTQPNAAKVIPQVLRRNAGAALQGDEAQAKLFIQTVAAVSDEALKAKIPSEKDMAIPEAGKDLIKIAASRQSVSGDAWQALTRLLAYKSFVNAPYSPPASLGQEGTKVPWSFSWLRDHYGGTPSIELRTLGPVPAEQAARHQLLNQTDPNANRALGPKFIWIIYAGSQPTPVLIDGFWIKNAVIANAHISYMGGPVMLENVTFVNCTFDIQQSAHGAGLVTSLADWTPADFTSS